MTLSPVPTSRTRFIRLPLLLLLAFPLAAQEWVAGVEGTSDSSFTYLTHFSRHGDYLFWQSANLLTYTTRNGFSETTVTSPGLGAGVLRRWNTPHRSFSLGTGYEVRWTERQVENAPPEDITEQGIMVEGDVIQNFGPRTSGRLGGRWSAANDWATVTGDLRYRLSRSFRAGPQVIYNGNDDIKAFAGGLVVEIPLSPNPTATVMTFRGGIARVEYLDGTRVTDPYFSAGVTVPF